MSMALLAQIVHILVYTLTALIVIRAVLSWFGMINPNFATNPIVSFVFQVTEPVLAPIRRIVPSFGMLDLSPMIALLLLWLIDSLVTRAAR